MPEYEHTQHGKLQFVLLALAFVPLAVGVWLEGERPGAVAIFLLPSLALAAVAASFGRLTVSDAGDALLLRYGPLPIVRKQIPYGDILSARPARSRWIDGWGIHFVPGRGWTYNLWGFDCVELVRREKCPLRIGTDDPAGLASFLQKKIG